MPNEFGDIVSNGELIEKLQRLNPNAEIKQHPQSWLGLMYSTVPAEKLVLPKDFYLNEKNGITNKHNTKSGMYVACHVELIEKTQNQTQVPKVGLLDKVKEKLFTPKEPDREM